MIQDRKKQQNAILLILILGALILLYFIYLAVSPSDSSIIPKSSQGNIDLTIVSDRTSSAAPEHSWVVDSKIKVQNLEKTINVLRTDLETKNSTLSSLKDDFNQSILENEDIISQLIQKVSDLENKSNITQKIDHTPSDNFSNVDVLSNDLVSGNDFITKNSSDNGRDTFFEDNSSWGAKKELKTPKGKSKTSSLKRNNLSHYVPSGSYVSATVLSGADASTNVVDRENPTPVLFRLNGDATSAGHSKIDLDGCLVQGSAIGDLSSERVKVRLLSMSCVTPNKEVIETQISGYISGSGKSGVRGHVVSREGDLVTSAALAGVLQGVTSLSQPKSNDDSSIDNIAGSALQASGLSAAGSAASSLSEYYINRAEQYQPVISLNPGTNVDIVFIEGVNLK